METLEAILPVESSASAEKVIKWPMEVRALLALLGKPTPAANRRKRPRHPLRLEMVLQFRDENEETTNAPIYTRDTSGAVLGFITSTPPKSGQQVVLKFDDLTGVTRRLPCQVGRCRHVRDGWYEGTLDLAPPPQKPERASGGLWWKIKYMVGAE